MTVGELIAKLSEVDNLDKVVLLGGDGAQCLGTEENIEDTDEADEAVFIYFANN